MTGNEAKLLIYGLLGESEASSAYFPSAQIEYMMRSTMNDIADRTEYLLRNVDGTVLAGLSITRAIDQIQMKRLETDTEGRLFPTTTEELWRKNNEWRSRPRGTPVWYYFDAQRNATGGSTVAMYPTQSSNTDYRLYYSSYPTNPGSSAADNLEIPTWCAHAVVYGTLQRAYLADSHRFSPSASAFYGRMYEALVDRLQVRARDRLPKRWAAGRDAARRVRPPKRMPDNIPEP